MRKSLRFGAAAVSTAAAVAVGALSTSAARADDVAIISVKIYNGTGAVIGIINPVDPSHNTRATALAVDIWTTTSTFFVPQTGFTVIYGNTCMKVPQSLAVHIYRDDLQTANGWNLYGGATQYNATLGYSSNSLGGALFFTQNNSNPANQLFVNHYSSAASCSGL